MREAGRGGAGTPDADFKKKERKKKKQYLVTGPSASCNVQVE